MAAAERTLNFSFTAHNEEQEGFIDIAQCLSSVNRKLFRQGMQYMIQEIRVESWSPDASQVAIYRLCDNWVNTNAWVKALAEWNEQNLEAARETGTESTLAKWRDFKVHMNKLHATDGVGENFLPDSFELADHPAGSVYQWSMSKFVVPNDGNFGGATHEYELYMVDATDVGVGQGLIEAYAESRSRPQPDDPNILTVTGGLYSDMEDVGEDLDDIVGNFQRENTNPPYPLNENDATASYPGINYGVDGTVGQILEGSMQIGQSVRSTLPGFVAPLGLLYVKCAGMNTGSVNVQIKIAPGSYQGVMARSMKEAN